MNYLYRTYASHNPAGIVINPGWYALAEAILTHTHIDRIMRRWFGIKEDPVKIRKRKRLPHKKKHPSPITDKILAMYRANKKLQNIEIAEMVGCTPRMVCIALRKHGIRRYKKRRTNK